MIVINIIIHDGTEPATILWTIRSRFFTFLCLSATVSTHVSITLCRNTAVLQSLLYYLTVKRSLYVQCNKVDLTLWTSLWLSITIPPVLRRKSPVWCKEVFGFYYMHTRESKSCVGPIDIQPGGPEEGIELTQ